LEAIDLVGTARSSPQPPLAVARRARLEVVVPTRHHRTKRFDRFCVLSNGGRMLALPDPSFSSRSVNRFGRNIA
jgi:hypothetical protein